MSKSRIEISLPCDYSEEDLNKKLKKSGGDPQTHTIVKKSLDARKKGRIRWRLILEAKTTFPIGSEALLPLPGVKKGTRVSIVGAGPAGLFSALLLSRAGAAVTLIERGSPVDRRQKAIHKFESSGHFDESNNYCYGEGGAGTFSDGKLTSRTKSIKRERDFIYQTLLENGAPDEILYLSHPHIGSDILIRVVESIRHKLIGRGVRLLFDTKINDMIADKNSVKLISDSNEFNSDAVIFAIGQWSSESYRMLMDHGVRFRTKAFALGCRVEHPQQLINEAQWGLAKLSGIKAAEYRLSHSMSNLLPTHSFCMCPGGKVVPATPNSNKSIVNGMSYYNRSSPFANAAVVASVDLNRLLKKEIGAAEALNWLDSLEERVYAIRSGYSIPACAISDFLESRYRSPIPQNSYPLGTYLHDMSELYPELVVQSLKLGLRRFSEKLKGYESGVMMGLESRTSAPIQVLRHPSGLVEGFQSLYFVGEGSGFAGGIVSSAADGIKAAVDIVNRFI